MTGHSQGGFMVEGCSLQLLSSHAWRAWECP